MKKVSVSHKIRRTFRPRKSGFHPSNPRYKWFVLTNVMVGTFMAVLNNTVVNVGLPKMMSSFGVGLSTIVWVQTAYMLAMASVMPVSGWLADKYGYKRIYFSGLFFFTLGSLLCGLSTNENILIFSRVIQGLGGGLIQPLGMAIILREFPLAQRGIALGFWGIASAASVSFGPVIGGYLSDNFNWQMIFNINVPVGIIAMILTFLIQREFTNNEHRKFDIVGFISVIIFLPLLLYALSEGNAVTNAEGWNAPHILFCFAISTIALAVFITRELTFEYPLIDLKLLANRNFGLCTLVVFIFNIGMFGSTFLLPLYLQNSMNYTALQSGYMFLPIGIIQGFVSPISGIISDKYNPKILPIIGITLLAISFYINSTLSFLSENAFIMISFYIRGFAMGIIFTPLNKMSFLTIPHRKMAQASSITNTLRQIGASFGVAFLTTMLTSRINFHSQVYSQAIQSQSPSFKNVSQQLTYFAQQHLGTPLYSATKQGQYLLLSHVNTQAYIQGIDDDFLLAAIITFIGIFPIFLLKTKNNKKNKQLNMPVQ